jgi:succinate dehydrogenase/fumarate reductase iron-sulfur protein
MSEGEIKIRIRRGGEAGDPEERFQNFTIRLRPRMTVLDALVAIQNEQDPTLGYRYSCRVGMCGTCAILVNGRPRWACRTRLDELGDTVTLGPLSNFPVLRDLATDMAPFFDKLKRARAWVEPNGEASKEPARISPESSERARIEPHVECITCGICYSACTMVGHEPAFLGPAALNRAYALVCDSRDAIGSERLEDVAHEHGVWRCHTQFNCTEACPKGISPTAAIQGLKRRAMMHGTKSFFGSILRGQAPGH